MKQKHSKKKDKHKTFRLSWGDDLWTDVQGTSETEVRGRLGSIFEGLGEAYQPSRIKKVKPWMSTV